MTLSILPLDDVLQEAMRMDREYFEKNPGEIQYFRVALDGEQLGPLQQGTLVRVTNYGHGRRLREFFPPNSLCV